MENHNDQEEVRVAIARQHEGRPRCKTCPYFVRFMVDKDEEYSGECRHGPPTCFKEPVFDWDPPLMAFFPKVAEESGCGRHPDFPAYIQSFRKPKWDLQDPDTLCAAVGFHGKILNALRNRGVKTVGDLVQLSTEDLLMTRNLGPMSVALIHKQLARLNLRLKD
jgi:hypothetical protein